ncbi:MAG: hypothetical protein AAB553_06130 [Patescibacteria group bacterium]
MINNIHDLLLSHNPKNERFYTIAIDGRGGSGKTAFAEYLKTLFPNFIFLNGDDYFEPVNNQIVWGAFNDKRFVRDVLEPLKTTNSFVYKPFNWHTKPHISNRSIKVDKGLCLERCFIFEMNLDWDMKIWVETPKEICLERGIAREHMPKDRVLAAWKEVWQPKEDEYIRDSKPIEQADIIIDGTNSFENQLIN